MSHFLSTDSGQDELKVHKQMVHLLIYLVITLCVSFLSYILLTLYGNSSCLLLGNHFFVGLWPINFSDIEILKSFGYPAIDTCTLILTRSTTSGTMLIYIFYVLVSQLWVRESYYNSSLIPLFVFLVLLMTITSLIPISQKAATLYSQSVYSAVSVNSVKSFAKICMFYSVVSLLIQRIFGLIRLKRKM
jgi:hypothetical protein